MYSGKLNGVKKRLVIFSLSIFRLFARAKKDQFIRTDTCPSHAFSCNEIIMSNSMYITTVLAYLVLLPIVKNHRVFLILSPQLVSDSSMLIFYLFVLTDA